MYLDANNLYGHSMSSYLPYANFKWEEYSERLMEEILKTPSNSPIGYVLEVDLEYPPEVKERTKRFPLCPESILPDIIDLISYQKDLLNGKLPFNNKLICNVNNKTEYVIHYRNLQFYLKMGLKIIKVHSIISFNQKPWLQVYIDLNTKRRSK